MTTQEKNDVETTYGFSAFNTESIYGFGTEQQAAQYLHWLNTGREINLFERSMDLTDDQADAFAVNLSDDLWELTESGDN